MNTRIRIVAALGFALALMTAWAQAADSGFYLGAGAGQAQISDNASFDESSTSYRGFAGYRLGVIPILDFAGEIGYSDLGSAESGGTTAKYQAKGADASVLVIFPITILDLYGRFGAMKYDLDKTFSGATTSSSGTAGVYGVGLGLRFGPLGVRAEYDRIDIKELKSVDVGQVSVYFQF